MLIVSKQSPNRPHPEVKPDKVLSPIGQRIRLAYGRAGFASRKAFVQSTGIDNMSLWRWETGKNKPETRDLEYLSELLNVSIDWLLTGNDRPQSHIVRETPATYTAFLETPLGESLPEDLRERLLEHDFAVPPSVQTWASLASDLIAARKGKAIESPTLEIKPREGTAYRVRPAKKR